MAKSKPIKIFHIHIADRLIEKFGTDATIKRHEVLCLLGQYRIPKWLRHDFLLEMSRLELIEIVNRKYIKVTKKPFDINPLLKKMHTRTQKDVAKEFDMSPSALSQQLKRYK